ncbi:MAG: M15 family metallopeptidase [Defluviitaleaceae bacterium]|nr:M15 family metallopeptidase [Defluviitaleaceae bacterium]
MRGKNRYHPYYVGRRSARLRFLAGIGTCLMLISAAGCVAFAIYMMLDTTRVQTNASPDTGAVFVYADSLTDSLTEETPDIFAEPIVEAVSWIHVMPPREELFIPEEELYGALPPIEEQIIPVPTPEPIIHEAPAPYIPMVYTFLPFYIPENTGIYAEFRRDRPDLDTETIIWMVNSFVHLPFYSYVQTNYQPNPLFITPAFRLPYGFTPPELVPVNHEDCHLRATPEAVAAFREMRATAHSAGFYLSVTSAFRTAARQLEIWVNGGRRDGRVARPYHSEHQTGRALDLWGPGGLLDANGPSPTGRWVADNAHLYGFIIRYRAETTHITGYIHEPWHITFVGREISMYMYANNILSLEEFNGRNPGVALPLSA